MMNLIIHIFVVRFVKSSRFKAYNSGQTVNIFRNLARSILERAIWKSKPKIEEQF
jgi:hypothetical protein